MSVFRPTVFVGTNLDPPPPLLLEILAKPLIKEVEWRSRRGKFIYNRTYNSVGLNKVSHLSRRDRASSRLKIKKIGIFVTENTEGEAFCMEGYSEKYTIVVGNSLLLEK